MSQRQMTASLVIDRPPREIEVRASDADRDAAAEVLSVSFAEGRLSVAEHDERVRAAYGARTLGELAGLTADLPGPAGDASIGRAPFVPDGIDRCLMCVLLICCPPVGIAWLLVARRRAISGGRADAADR
jgi:hypothetical protein